MSIQWHLYYKAEYNTHPHSTVQEMRVAHNKAVLFAREMEERELQERQQ